MWLLTTRNRPALCQAVLDACIATGVTTPGVVWMDGCDYGPLRLPPGWTAVAERDHWNIGEIMRRFYAAHPGLPWYGWMADDCLPHSVGWDHALVDTAGRWCIAYPNDQWQQGRKQSDGSPHVTSIVCMGGDLVRTMGFWVLPLQVQMYIDDVWESVAVPLGLMRYRPDVISEHRHVCNGKRPEDSTDTRQFRGVPFPAQDRAIYEMWRKSQAYDDVLAKVRGACHGR